ncbi:MAG: NACHT domain-containing protein [Verrucomicrobiota bacterium]
MEKFDWPRYWHSQNSAIFCGEDGEGFFVDPNTDGLQLHNQDCQVIEDLFNRSQVLVLCGPPGSGKTSELERLRQKIETNITPNQTLLFYHASQFGTGSNLADLTTRLPLWKKSQESGKEIILIIDALDEALLREKTLLNSLIGLLKYQQLETLRLVLSCRSAAWEPETGNTLARLWGSEGKQIVFELCPLRRHDVKLAADSDADTFFDEIVKNDAIPLARWPMTLNMLLEQFEKSGSLAGTRREFYKNSIKRLIDEWDSKRKRRTQSLLGNASKKEKIQLARRIAAMFMFSGKSALVLSDRSSDPAHLTYSDVLGKRSAEILDIGKTFDISQFEIESLAQSNLFEPFGTSLEAPAPAVKFAHHTFAELLAAEYVESLPSTELLHLLCLPTDDGKEMVAPQMIQVASWLASAPDNELFFELLLQHHPETLLQADLSLYSVGQKESLVRRLIDIAETQDPGPSRSISSLSHTITFPGLSDILRPVILDSSRNHWVRQFSLEFARKCQLSDLDSALWEILERPHDEMRRDAGYALSVIEKNPQPWKKKLLQLAAGELVSDTDDTLKGIALRLLVPTCISVRETIPYLTYPKEESFFGSYQAFLYRQLPGYLLPEDLPDSIEFLSSLRACFDSLSPFQKFADRVFEMACDNLDQPEIAIPLVEMWLAKARKFQPLPKVADQSEIASVFSDSAQVNTFVSTALNHPDTKVEDVVLLLGYLSQMDLGWLLEQLSSALESRRKIWAMAIRFHTGSESREKYRALLQQSYKQYPEIRDRFPPITKAGLDLHDTMLRFERAGELHLTRRREQSARRQKARSNKNPTWQNMFEEGLEQCRGGHAYGWVNVIPPLLAKADSLNFTSLDIDSAPLFANLSIKDKSLLRTTAKKFLLEFNDKRNKEEQRTNGSNAAYHAVRWLRDELNDDEKLNAAVREKWIAALIDYSSNAEDEHKEMVKLAFELNPSECRKWLKTMLERRLNDESEGWFSDFHAFNQIWDRAFSELLAEILSSPSIKPQSMRDGLMFLIKNDRSAAIDFAQAFLQRLQNSCTNLKSPSDRAFAGTALLILHSEMWTQIWPLIASDLESTRKLFLENVSDFDLRSFTFLSSLDSDQIADLYLLLIHLFPPSDDPPLSREATFVTPEDECISLRGDCTRELTRRGDTEQLGRILNHLTPDQEGGIRWQLHEATQNKNRLEWSPIACKDLLKLVQHSHASLVRNGDDLQAVILYSLEHFQENLQRQNISRVWDGDSPKREEILSHEIEQWLSRDLKGITVNREVVVNRLNQRVDLKVEALPHDSSGENLITVIIEIKRAHDNRITKSNILESIKEQLIERYLNSEPEWSHGIYLVGWFKSKGRWEKPQFLKSKLPKGARSELRKYCDKATQQSGNKIASFLLDCSFPK